MAAALGAQSGCFSSAGTALKAHRASGAIETVHDKLTASDRAQLEDTVRNTVQRLTPAGMAGIVNNLMYTVGFIRVMGGYEGATATDRSGAGKVYRQADQRAVDTISPMLAWMLDGASHPNTIASVARVQRMHDGFAKKYSFSNASYLHGIAYFTLSFDEMFKLMGVNIFSEEEKRAFVYHWRTIGEHMGVQDLPVNWAGMQQVLQEYEQAPEWFGPSVEGRRGAEALLQQYVERWFPRPIRPLGRWTALSLVPDHVIAAVGQPKPPAAVVHATRFALRWLTLLQTKLLWRFASSSYSGSGLALANEGTKP